MAQRATEIKGPVRPKRNRGKHGKQPSADAALDLESVLEGESHDNLFANVTADLILRNRDAQPLQLALPSSSKSELHKSRFLGSTTGLIVPKGEARPSPVKPPTDDGSAPPDAAAELEHLRDELATLRATLAERETALAQALDTARQHDESSVASAGAAPPSDAANLAQAEAVWREQSERELAAVRAQADTARAESEEHIRSLRDELTTLQVTLADRDAALKSALDTKQSHEHREPQDQATLSAAEQAWKTAESQRMAEAEAQWREQAAASLADMRAQAESAREQGEAELRNLRDELATLRSTLEDRERALAQADSNHQQARESWEQESQTAEQVRKTDEAARLAEAEAKWREQSDKFLSEARAQADAARDQADKEIRSLRDETATLRSTIADREAALANADSDHEQARKSWEQTNQAALSKAEQAWKAAEASRLADAEKRWRELSDRTIAEIRTQTEAARKQADSRIRTLQEQMSALEAKLAEQETALAEAAQVTEQVREQGRQELEAALAKAKAHEAGEAQRMAAAEAQWRNQSADAIRDAQSRAEAAEGALIQLRREADRARADSVGGSIRQHSEPRHSEAPRASFGAKPHREPEAAIRLPSRDELLRGGDSSKVTIQSHRMMSEQEAPKKRGMGRDILVVAALAVITIVAYPRIAPLLPPAWRAQIAAVIGEYGSPQNVAPQGSATIIRDVNLRAGPSTTSQVIATLPAGMQVVTILRRDDWRLIQTPGVGNAQPQRGWVFSSFLREQAVNAEDDVETATEESEAP